MIYLSYQSMPINLGNVPSADYMIFDDDSGDVVYEGTAFRRPGATSLVVDVSDICKPGKPRDISAFPGEVWAVAAGAIGEYSNSNTSDTQAVLYDYSYTRNTISGSMVTGALTLLSDSITGTVSDHQRLFFSAVAYPTDVRKATATVNGVEKVILDTGAGYNWSLFGIDLSTWKDIEKADKITISVSDRGATKTATLRLSHGCPDYALHYLNTHGGWDSLLCYGRTSEKYTRHTYDNAQPIARADKGITRQVVQFGEEIETSYKVATEWLTRENGLRIGEVVGSPSMYLEDLRDKARPLIPVIGDTSSVELLDYDKNGSQLVNYTISLDLAQTRRRG